MKNNEKSWFIELLKTKSIISATTFAIFACGSVCGMDLQSDETSKNSNTPTKEIMNGSEVGLPKSPSSPYIPPHLNPQSSMQFTPPPPPTTPTLPKNKFHYRPKQKWYHTSSSGSEVNIQIGTKYRETQTLRICNELENFRKAFADEVKNLNPCTVSGLMSLADQKKNDLNILLSRLENQEFLDKNSVDSSLESFEGAILKTKSAMGQTVEELFAQNPESNEVVLRWSALDNLRDEFAKLKEQVKQLVEQQGKGTK